MQSLKLDKGRFSLCAAIDSTQTSESCISHTASNSQAKGGQTQCTDISKPGIPLKFFSTGCAFVLVAVALKKSI